MGWLDEEADPEDNLERLGVSMKVSACVPWCTILEV